MSNRYSVTVFASVSDRNNIQSSIIFLMYFVSVVETDTKQLDQPDKPDSSQQVRPIELIRTPARSFGSHRLFKCHHVSCSRLSTRKKLQRSCNLGPEIINYYYLKCKPRRVVALLRVSELSTIHATNLNNIVKTFFCLTFV